MLVTIWQLEIVPNQHEISPQIIKKFEVPGNWYWPHQVKHQCSCPAFHLLCHCHFLNPIFQSLFLSKQKAMSFEHTIPSCAFFVWYSCFFYCFDKQYSFQEGHHQTNPSEERRESCSCGKLKCFLKSQMFLCQVIHMFWENSLQSSCISL